ncbi:MAG: winged helix-turn-helix transcriptional regulator [Rhodospirillaceae bacterium]|nr:winged helix-turn-helix transcriptional regulator [Rhodospirillaceae bacterium]MBT7957689.1 winged helix-turn-helix transcriptional regulator [Rhodospirillaceae bacterium]
MNAKFDLTIPSSIRAPKTDHAYPNLELEDYLTYRVSTLSRMLDRQSVRFLSDKFGISLTERRILARLAQCDSSTVRQLAVELSVDKGRISRATASLIAMDCVERGSDPRDGRSAIFTITSTGRSLETEIVDQGRARQALLLNQLEPVERIHLYQALGKLREFLDEEISSGISSYEDIA